MMKNRKFFGAIVLALVLLLSMAIVGCQKECSHEYTESVVAPTCTAEGYTVHTCQKCSDSYNDSIVPITAHRFNGGSCVYCSFNQPTEAIVPDTTWYTEDGAVFTLTTKEQLAGIAALVNEGNTLDGVMIYLDADFDLGYAPWTPIGNADFAFAGTLAGNGHKISNLAISSTGSYVGLFGNVSGEIGNFTIDNASIFVNGSNNYVAIACGYSVNKITAITVDGYVDAKDCAMVGGLIGSSKGLITDCVSTTEVVGFESVGGIAGELNVTTNVFINLTNNGKISGGNYTGGIFGKFSGGNSVIVIDKTENYGDVSGKAYVGGIIGYVEAKDGSIIQSATNSSAVSGEYYVGAIAGKSSKVAISACSNAGSEISGSSCELVSDVYYAYLGGYVGYGYKVDNCINNSDITYTARGNYVGGIAGYLENDVTECENNGHITGHDHVGGIAGGVATSNAATVINLKNNGNISGKAYIGGIAGQWSYSNPITFGESDNSGAISGSTYVGGIMGSFNYKTSAVISAYNLANTGDVTATDCQVGGLFGFINGKDSSVISNSSVKANIKGLYLVGGLIGKTDSVKLLDSTNEGSTVTATGFIIEGEETNVYLGGYVGYAYRVSGCTNTVDINYTSLGNFVGGVVGYATSDLNKCTNNASITSASGNVGGIAGRLRAVHKGNTFSQLTNNGAVKGTNRVGGVVGSIYQSVNYCHWVTVNATEFNNSGSVDGNDCVGGIFGYVYLNNSHDNLYCNPDDGRSKLVGANLTNGGAISGASNVGEILGYFDSDDKSTIDNYTVTGKITIGNKLLEGTYDVGTIYDLTLTNRVALEVESPET